MTKIPSSLINKRGISLSELPKKNTKKTKNYSLKKRKIKGTREMNFSTNVVQKLYETCREVFGNGGPGYIPPPADIQRLNSFLDSMKPEDVHLAPNMPFFKGSTKAEEDPRITYIHLHECTKFSIGIFCLPPSAVIPLHNHPRMTVFSKLLFGSLRVKSYDWVLDDHVISNTHHGNADDQTIRNCQHPRIQLAKVHADADFTAPCPTSVLFPAAGGNLHCFKALTPCAILDVLGPPYNESEDRPCTYFQDFPYSKFSGVTELGPEEDGSKYAWLQEREKPENCIVVGAMFP